MGNMMMQWSGLNNWLLKTGNFLTLFVLLVFFFLLDGWTCLTSNGNFLILQFRLTSNENSFIYVWFQVWFGISFLFFPLFFQLGFLYIIWFAFQSIIWPALFMCQVHNIGTTYHICFFIYFFFVWLLWLNLPVSKQLRLETIYFWVLLFAPLSLLYTPLI